MVNILKTRTQPSTFYKVKAHINIERNEQAYILTKIRPRKWYSFVLKPYEHAHTTPFYFQKDIWPGPIKRPDKGLRIYLTKHDKKKQHCNHNKSIP